MQHSGLSKKGFVRIVHQGKISLPKLSALVKRLHEIVDILGLWHLAQKLAPFLVELLWLQLHVLLLGEVEELGVLLNDVIGVLVLLKDVHHFIKSETTYLQQL